MSRPRWPRTRLVKVTADDIALGVPGDAMACPVAIAMNREVPSIGDWAVTRAKYNGRWVGVAEWTGAIPVRIRLTQSVGRFIGDFDAGKPVEPFVFRNWR